MDGVGLPLLLRVVAVCAVSAWSGNIFSDKLARLHFDGPLGVGAAGVDGMNGAAVSDAARGVPATSVIVREWNEWGAGLPDWLRVVRALDGYVWEVVASNSAATATPVLEALERFLPARFFEVPE